MLEHALEAKPQSDDMPLHAGDASDARKPFVSPSVQELGRMSRLTLVGGSL